MALKATIFKAQLHIADMDRQYYAEHALTIARHPSETDERMMVRVLVFALHAQEHLEFAKGLGDPDEPDLWRKDLTGLIEEWIVLGQPDEKEVLKACGRARRVFVYGYNYAANPWWGVNESKLQRAKNLSVRLIRQSGEATLASLAQKTMKLHCTIQDGQIWLSDGERTVDIELKTLRE